MAMGAMMVRATLWTVASLVIGKDMVLVEKQVVFD